MRRKTKKWGDEMQDKKKCRDKRQDKKRGDKTQDKKKLGDEM